MKTLEELGISHAPWHTYELHAPKETWVADSTDGLICSPTRDANARLIAAAPELYEALREAVIEMCHTCKAYVSDNHGCNSSGECFVKRWRAALEKAGGAE